MEAQILTNSTTRMLLESVENSNEVLSTPKTLEKQEEIYPELQAFVDSRGRPAIFLLLHRDDSLHWGHAFEMRFLLEGKQFEDLDFVIHSGGGYLPAAYTIIRMLRSHTNKRLNACVPVQAMSAATLLCIGADAIILDEQANLGPLDSQVRVEGKNDYKSALNPFKSLEELTISAQNTVFPLVNKLQERRDLAVSDCFKLATEFVEAVNSSLLTKLDSEKLGEFRRQLSEGEEYGKRVMTELAHWPPGESGEVIWSLVYKYPSHDYVIDYYELKNLGFHVELFENEKERIAVTDLIKCLVDQKTRIGCQTIIKLVEPSSYSQAG